MPIYDYRCDSCGTTYDVFHKVREVEEDIVCPECKSTNHTRLISAPSISMKKSAAAQLAPCGEPVGACGGHCHCN